MAALNIAITETGDPNLPMVTDDEGEQFPAVSEEAMRIRRQRLRMDEPHMLQFIEQYGVIHLLDTDFVDFLTYTETEDKGGATVYKGTRWGGSFWHHDPAAPETLRDFTRRVRRMLGLENVDASQPRFFVRAANNSLELQDTLRLRDALRRIFPSTRFYLLILVDYQPANVAGMYQLAGPDGADMLFYMIDIEKYGDGSCEATQMMLQIFGENYAVAVSEALRIFSGCQDAPTPTVSANITELIGRCFQFDGGSCNNALFAPVQFQGLRMKARDNYSSDEDPLKDLFKVREATFVVPETSAPGENLEVPVFGGMYNVTVPAGAVPGKTHILLRLKEGELHAFLAQLY